MKYDDRDTQRPGWKFAEYELKGIPLRVVIGPRDLANGMVEIARRDTKEKAQFSIDSETETLTTEPLYVAIADEDCNVILDENTPIDVIRNCVKIFLKNKKQATNLSFLLSIIFLNALFHKG
mgnify:CR=1 FL=1